MSEVSYKLQTQKGIMRDNPLGNVACFTDGDMVRDSGIGIRKLAGWDKIYNGNSRIIRELYVTTYNNLIRMYVFTNSEILQIDMQPQSFAVVGIVDRTPEFWVTPSFGEPDLMFVTTSWTIIIPVPDEESEKIPYFFFVGLSNTQDISTSNESIVYYGRTDENIPFAPLIPTGSTEPIQTSGGVQAFGQYLLIYGNNGVINWCELGDPLVWPIHNLIAISTKKVVGCQKFLQTLLFWTLSELVEVSTDATNEFISTVRCPSITILSPKSIVAARDNTFFWIGSEYFYCYSGVLNPLPNEFNKNFFFQNYNSYQPGKVFGIYVENFTEIWWGWCYGEAIENNRFIVYNMTSKSWVDNTLGRSTGITSSELKQPFLASTTQSFTMPGSYPVYRHEVGWDHVEDNISFPILAYAESNRFSLDTISPQSQQKDLQMRITRIEPDVLMGSTDLDIQINNYPYLNTNPIEGENYTYSNNQGMIPTRDMVSNGTIKITANNLGCWFQTGLHKIWFVPGPPRPSVPISNPPT